MTIFAMPSGRGKFHKRAGWPYGCPVFISDWPGPGEPAFEVCRMARQELKAPLAMRLGAERKKGHICVYEAFYDGHAPDHGLCAIKA